MLDCALNYTSKWQQCNFSISTGSLEMNHKNFEKAKIMVKTNLIQLLHSFPITRVTKIVLKLSLPWVIMLPSKWENLFYKVNAFLRKNYHLCWTAGRANILCKYIIYIFFQFWAWVLQFIFYVISEKSSF